MVASAASVAIMYICCNSFYSILVMFWLEDCALICMAVCICVSFCCRARRCTAASPTGVTTELPPDVAAVGKNTAQDDKQPKYKPSHDPMLQCGNASYTTMHFYRIRTP